MKKNYLFLLLFAWLQGAYAQSLEVPTTKEGAPEQLITHVGYTVSYNPDWLIPNWVAWELTGEETTGDVGRNSQFIPDPMVEGRSATSYDYSRSGYDRGHMAPAGDMKWDQQAMAESFYLSNICPQNHDINSGTWERLENRCRGWAKFHGKVWICCGPIVSDQPKTIGENQVVVPDGFFKVVCTERRGRYHAVGFIYPNQPQDGDFWQYACPVDEVELLLGHDFFPSLPDDVEDAMESEWDQKFWTSN